MLHPAYFPDVTLHFYRFRVILPSDRDETTPIGQGEEFFYALKINGVETEMVVFRGENHGLSRGGKPVNLVERLDRVLEWFGRYP